MFEEMKYNRIDGGNAMGELVAYGKEVRSVFELIGTAVSINNGQSF